MVYDTGLPGQFAQKVEVVWEQLLRVYEALGADVGERLSARAVPWHLRSNALL